MEISWKRVSRWDYDMFSRNTRLYLMAGDKETANEISEACIAKFGIGPDLRRQSDDRFYFDRAGFQLPPK